MNDFTSYCLNEFKNNNYSEEPCDNFKTISLSNNNYLNLEQILKSHDSDKVIYWHSKKSNYKILSFGVLKEAKNFKELKDLYQLAKSNHQLKILGAMNFDKKENHNSKFIIPQLLIINNDNHKTSEIIINISNHDQLNLDFIKKRNLTFSHNEINKKALIPEKDTWIKNVNQSIEEINQRTYEKLVLSRRMILTFKNEINPVEDFLSRTESNKRAKQSFFYKYDDEVFCSFSPEHLFTYDQLVTVDIIAGTIAKGNNDEQNQKNITKILESNKDKLEHELVLNDVKSRLDMISSEVSLTKKREPLVLDKIIHLHSEFTCKNKQNCGPIDYLESLHPTPAVGGFPNKNIAGKIKDIEKIDRGLYAGPFGLISGDYCEIGVGIRSYTIKNNTKTIYSGCGIVKSSNPHEEWQETKNKMLTLS